MKKKRTKKFNPNKLLPSQVKQLQQEAQYKKGWCIKKYAEKKQIEF